MRAYKERRIVNDGGSPHDEGEGMRGLDGAGLDGFTV